MIDEVGYESQPKEAAYPIGIHFRRPVFPRGCTILLTIADAPAAADLLQQLAECDIYGPGNLSEGVSEIHTVRNHSR